ncbi:hypothetical protein NDU88_001306 [Pleurodeles waltl]|uniref:Uncharacterized protein n=1 Tax=Pleurodeles waltl TaxID=8319 RepID=A0AAV7VYS6_PLEWA|nr:hypothetical protein NDU88_001306 [Pleurodeles waltl]
MFQVEHGVEEHLEDLQFRFHGGVGLLGVSVGESSSVFCFHQAFDGLGSALGNRGGVLCHNMVGGTLSPAWLLLATDDAETKVLHLLAHKRSAAIIKCDFNRTNKDCTGTNVPSE